MLGIFAGQAVHVKGDLVYVLDGTQVRQFPAKDGYRHVFQVTGQGIITIQQYILGIGRHVLQGPGLHIQGVGMVPGRARRGPMAQGDPGVAIFTGDHGEGGVHKELRHPGGLGAGENRGIVPFESVSQVHRRGAGQENGDGIHLGRRHGPAVERKGGVIYVRWGVCRDGLVVLVEREKPPQAQDQKAPQPEKDNAMIHTTSLMDAVFEISH